MSLAIEDPTRLPGETLHDQDGGKVGEVKELYSAGDDEEPMWITVEVETGVGQQRLVFVPMARLKHDQDQLRAPYSIQHLVGSPDVEAGGELSKQADTALRNYYAIGLADQEVRTDNETYADRVTDSDEAPRRTSGES